MNKKIYAKAAILINTDQKVVAMFPPCTGQDLALAYLQTWFCTPVTVEFFSEFKGFGGDQ